MWKLGGMVGIGHCHTERVPELRHELIQIEIQFSAYYYYFINSIEQY